MTGPSLKLQGRASIGGQALFGPLSLHVEGGSLTCLLGPSGIGKSTLLRLIAGLAPYVAFEGTVTCSDAGPAAARATLMQQSDMLLPWANVLANVTIGQRLRGERLDVDRAQHLVAAVGLEGLESHLPATLSGGQRQRVALARSLMEDRPIVLLDEPFSALDIKTRAEMQALALKLLAGRTILLVTHDPGEAARMAKAVAVMHADHIRIMPAPSTPAPRASAMPETIAFAAELVSEMMGEMA